MSSEIREVVTAVYRLSQAFKSAGMDPPLAIEVSGETLGRMEQLCSQVKFMDTDEDCHRIAGIFLRGSLPAASGGSAA
jgi:hypothetical protein